MTAISSDQDPPVAGRENIHVVVVGHVDHGKSTILSRLLVDTDSLTDGKLGFVKEACRRNAKLFEYAFLLDVLKDEQAQGITIDAARCFFKTDKRNYIIIDAPGHIEFLKNMVTGAARAEAAFLVIDVTEGVQENSRRHGYMLSLLKIRQVAVLINKMDLSSYKREQYEAVKDECLKFLEQIGIEPRCFIPVSAMQGDNIVNKTENMPWYSGQTVLQVLEGFEGEKLPEEKPFRMPVQGIYKFSRDGDNRRIVAGTIEAGRLKVGDELIFYPSGKTSQVKSIEAFNEETKDEIGAGYATGFTLSEQIFVSRGELATVAGQHKPWVTSRVRAKIFWLGKEPLRKEQEYLLKLGTARIGVYLEEVTRVIDAVSLDVLSKEQVDKHDVAECILKLDRDIAIDTPDLLLATSRFALVDNYEICGGGIVEEALTDSLTENREKVHLRNIKWERGYVESEERAERNYQKATLILVTGKKEMGRKQVAKALEYRLFEEGKQVYFFSMGNLLYGIDADIKNEAKNNKKEHFRRLSEVANIMLDAGLILIVSVIELTKDDLRQLSTGVDHEKINVVWLGEDITSDVNVSLHIADPLPEDKTVAKIIEYMQERGVITTPW